MFSFNSVVIELTVYQLYLIWKASVQRCCGDQVIQGWKRRKKEEKKELIEDNSVTILLMLNIYIYIYIYGPRSAIGRAPDS